MRWQPWVLFKGVLGFEVPGLQFSVSDIGFREAF